MKTLNIRFEKIVGFIESSSSDPLNIVRQNSRTEIRRNFFSNRAVDKWKNLSSELKHCRSIEYIYYFSLKKKMYTLLLKFSDLRDIVPPVEAKDDKDLDLCWTVIPSIIPYLLLFILLYLTCFATFVLILFISYIYILYILSQISKNKIIPYLYIY